MERLYNRRKSY